MVNKKHTAAGSVLRRASIAAICAAIGVFFLIAAIPSDPQAGIGIALWTPCIVAAIAFCATIGVRTITGVAAVALGASLGGSVGLMFGVRIIDPSLFVCGSIMLLLALPAATAAASISTAVYNAKAHSEPNTAPNLATQPNQPLSADEEN